MTKLFLFIAIFGLVACNNSSTSTKSTDSTSTDQTNVQNVNGNVPDTTSGMTLNQPLPVDSSRVKDSARKSHAPH